MTAAIQTILLLLVVLVVVAIVARRPNAASSILLVIAGIGLALTPRLPRIELAPELVLVLLGILPPLIYSAPRCHEAFFSARNHNSEQDARGVTSPAIIFFLSQNMGKPASSLDSIRKSHHDQKNLAGLHHYDSCTGPGFPYCCTISECVYGNNGRTPQGRRPPRLRSDTRAASYAYDAGPTLLFQQCFDRG
jgi:hypothetical protein